MATDGELTVVRRLAGYAYGQWSVDWPESVPEEQRPKLADDREHGYVHRLGSGSGRMGRRFVRADVSVTAAEYDKNGRVPHTGYSNVEDVLDAAVAQTDEDALVERAITRDGLGVLRPGVDFRVGDLVEVMIWGCAVPLPVTAIEAVTEAGAVVDWRVTVGGQVVSDDVERKRANADLERAVWGERRERLKVAREASEAKAAAAAADRRAGDAQSSADVAQSSADQAGQGVQNLQEILAGKNATAQDVTDQLAALNAQLQARDEPTGPLIPAYIAANTERWKMQDQVNKMQQLEQQRLRELAESTQAATAANTKARLLGEQLAEAKRREDNLRPKMSVAYQQQWLKEPYTTPDGLFLFESDKKSLDRGFYITALGDWVGQIAVFVSNVDFANNAAGTEILLGTVTKTARRGFYKATRLVGASQVVVLTIPSE
ncbi:hypothetical protein ACN4DT_03045 [Corynebacterium macclintockiae]|uniref:hypothetical protein n=1 Tax=Corynebacterium macclintockiae TaxID=2913501 RepID=UPI003EB8DD9D